MEEEYKCEFCGFVSPKLRSLKFHMNYCKANPNKVTFDPGTKGKKRNSISDEQKKILSDRMKTYHKSKAGEYICQYCGATFTSQQGCTYHERYCKSNPNREVGHMKGYHHTDETKAKIGDVSRGVSHPYYGGVSGMSKVEKYILEMLRNRQNDLSITDIQYNYKINDKAFDFAIFKEDKLVLLIEVDGEYSHGMIYDTDGKTINNYGDCSRFTKVPDGVKLIVCDGKRKDDIIKEIIDILDKDYDKWINDIVMDLPYDFPYPTYDTSRMLKDYIHLKEYKDMNLRSRICDSLIKNFHKSIYHASVGHCVSPYDAWHDKELLRKCVENRFIYASNLSSQKIVDGFNVCKLAPKVSVFSASVAKYIITKYLNEYNIITDPFSGFSGRMIGALASGKNYIGYDINEDHVRESADILWFLRENNLIDDTCWTSVWKKDLLASDDIVDCECVFTCPPYNLKERWNGDAETDKSCDEWIDEVMKRYKCKRYVFVVDDTSKYKEYIKEKINNKYHFSTNDEYILVIDKEV